MNFFPAEVFFVILKLFPFMVYGFIRNFVLFLTPRRYRPRKDIKGQNVLITGAGSGIGRELAIQFSEQSVNLVLLDLHNDSLKETAKLLDSRSKSFLYECDVADRLRVYEVSKLVKDELGKVDILVNNAGIVGGKKLLDLPDEQIQRVLEVNTLSHFWMCKAFLPEMIRDNQGHIVCMASMAGLSGFPFLTEYCASKFGAIGFMESLIVELAALNLDGIKVTMICPNFIATGLFEGLRPPLTVCMSPEWVAKEVLHAVLEEKELQMLPGWTYIIILLKWTMPNNAVKRFCRDSGLLNIMDEFKGRKNIGGTNGVITKTVINS